MSSSVKVNDKRLRDYLRRVDAANTNVIDIGIFAESGREDGQYTNAQIGAVHELGLGVPRRSWLRDPIRQNDRRFAAVIADEIKAYMQGVGSPEPYLTRAALWIAGQLQKNIAQGQFEPNAESTIEAKGSSRPLIDTGQMRAAITGIVRRIRGI